MTDLVGTGVRGALAIIAVALLAAFFAPSAFAQTSGSAGHEYTEDVPDAGGNQSSGNVGGGGGGNGSDNGGSGGTTQGGGTGDTVPSSAAGDFQAAGDDGAGAAGLAQATNPDRVGSQQNTGTGGGRATTPDQSAQSTTVTPSLSAPTPVTVATSSAPRSSNDGDTNVALLAGIGLVLLAIGGIVWYRRRYPETLIERPVPRLPHRLPS